MISLKNKVIFSFILSGLLFAQRIFRFYEKAEVTLPPNYLGIGFWLSTFVALCLENDEDNVWGEISGINNFGGIMCTLNCKVGGPVGGVGGVLKWN